MIIPALGLLSFIFCVFFNVYEEPLDMTQFEDNGESSVNKIQAAGESELANV